MGEDQINFKDRVNKTVCIALNGMKYSMKRFTIAQEIKLKKLFSGDLELWQKGLNNLDGETLVKTLWVFLEDYTSFPSWETLANELTGDLEEKLNILKAISSCIMVAMPDAQESIKKKIDGVNQNLKTFLQDSSTGPGSTTPSRKRTAGPRVKSKNARITK